MARSRRTAVSTLSVAVLLGAGIAVAGPPTVATAGRLLTGADVKDGSLTTKDYRTGSVRSVDIRDGSITAADLAPGARTGARGPQGAKGDPGQPGAPASGGGGATYEVATWTVGHTADGSYDLSRTAGDRIPAYADVTGVSVVSSDPMRYCSLTFRVGSEVVASLTGADRGPFGTGQPGGRAVGSTLVGGDGAALTAVTQCRNGYDTAPVPTHEATVTLRWTVLPSQPTRVLN